MLLLEEAQFPGQGTRILQALWGQLKKKKSSKCDAHLCSRIIVHICYFILTTNRVECKTNRVECKNDYAK